MTFVGRSRAIKIERGGGGGGGEGETICTCSVLSGGPRGHKPPWAVVASIRQAPISITSGYQCDESSRICLRLLYDIIGDFGGEVSDVGGGELAFYLPPENTGHWRPENSAALFEVESAVDTDAMAILRAGQERPKSRPLLSALRKARHNQHWLALSELSRHRGSDATGYGWGRPASCAELTYIPS